MNDLLYMTGTTPEGCVLIGGVWRLAHQEGFPLELSRMIVEERGWRIDWLEAMADASIDDNLPALMRQCESFMDGNTILRLKLVFQRLVDTEGKTYQQIIDGKRENAKRFEAVTYAFAKALSQQAVT